MCAYFKVSGLIPSPNMHILVKLCITKLKETKDQATCDLYVYISDYWFTSTHQHNV